VPAATGILATDLGLLRSTWQDEAQSRDIHRQVEAMASGDQIAYTPRMPGEPEEHRRQRPRFAARLYGRALDLLTYLYARTPVREGSERWREVLWDHGAGLDVVMEQVDRVARATGTALVVAVPDTDDDEARLAGRFEPTGVSLYVLPRSRWCGLSHPSDARQLHTALVQWGTATVVDQSGVVREETDWRVFAPDGVYRFVGTTLGSAEPTGETAAYCVCPNTIDTLTWKGQQLGCRDIAANLSAVNALAEQIPHTALLSRGQPVIANHKGATNIVLAPDAAIELSSAEDFKIVAPGADINGMLAAEQMLLDSLAIDWGLPKRAFSVRSVQEPYSAAVIQASQYELQQDRLRRERVAREWERRIHRAASRVWTAATGETIDPSVRVLYTQMQGPTTAYEALAEVRFLVDNGIIPRAEVLRTLRPWMLADDIDAALAAADTEADERAQRVALTAGHVEMTDGSDDASGSGDPERVASGDAPDDGSAAE